MMTGSHSFENQITCEGPRNFHGQKLIDISPEDLICEEPTILRFGSDSNTVVEGGTLYLVCEASGNPTPDITVILPSGLNATVESGGRVTVDVNGTITITNVTAADAGLYICTAGKTLYMVCEASGIPTPDITVIFPSGLNVTVESGGRVTVGVNGTITMANVTAADAGLYVCIAANNLGSTFATLVINAPLKVTTTGPVTTVATTGTSPTVPTTGVSPTVATTGISPTVPTTGISPTVPTTGISTIVATTGTSPTVATTGISTTVPTTGVSPTVATTGISPTVATTGISPTVTQVQLQPAHSFSLPVLIGSVCGAVAGTVLIGIIILTIWCKRKTQNPPSGPTPPVVFSNASASVAISGHDNHETGRAASEFLEYEDVVLRPNSAGLRQQPAVYQSLGPRQQPAVYHNLGPNRNRVPSDDLPPLPPPNTAQDIQHYYQSPAQDTQHYYQSLKKSQSKD
ncbi:PXDN [Branchiostoma lanceolatum]|uniref:PXDN protein n=1 Tax=Branchiostoma lanceolatum TaxID=7740 RepID=A0A8J9ZX92_BRALA|nr:PXDN [Branchiostoma lanceolatum]